ncbi:MAG: hypothetical protein AAF958_05890 [Planctomycetota bacterium]
MRLKCPGCSQLINVPDTAAGKIVACPCGKQLRAPQPSAAAASPATRAPMASPPAAAPGAPASHRPASHRPTPSPPAPSPPASHRPASHPPAPSPFAPGDFDDLTEADLSPIRGVSRPGAAVAKPAAGSDRAKLQQYLKEDEGKGWQNSIESEHPAVLKTIGTINFVFAFLNGLLLVAIMGLMGLVELPPEIENAKGVYLAILITAFSFDIAMCAGAGLACFLDFKFCWYFLIFAYSMTVISHVCRIVNSFLLDAGWVSIGFGVFMLLLSCIIRLMFQAKEIRSFYKTTESPWYGVVLADLAGALLGGGLGLATILLGE